MATVKRNIKVGDNLNGVTIYFDFTNWSSITNNDIYNIDLIVADENNKIIIERYASSSITANLYLVRNGTRLHVAWFRPATQKGVYVANVTLPNNFGTVTSISKYNTFQNNVYNGITADIPIGLNFNGTKVNTIYFNGIQVNKVYLNGEQVF